MNVIQSIHEISLMLHAIGENGIDMVEYTKGN